MKIKFISLRRYKRLSLCGIDEFEMTITEMVQLILGTNGSGKSSLLDVMTPLPPDPKAFHKDGYKTIEIEHNHNHYVLDSRFDPKVVHSFMKNGVELNDGGTVTVQKSLVKQEFGIDQATHDLLVTGYDRFHQMTATKRREWFTRLCDVRYDYAIAVYNRLKERHRDTVGALKLSKNRLVVEVQKILSEDREIELRQELLDFQKRLDYWYSVKDQVTRSQDSYEKEIEQILSEIQDLSTKMLKLRIQTPPELTEVSADTIDELIRIQREKISYDESEMNQLYRQLTEIRKTLETLENNSSVSRDQLLQANNELQAKIAVSYQQLSMIQPNYYDFYNDIVKVDFALKSIETAQPALLEIMANIPKNESKVLGNGGLKASEVNLINLNNLRRKQAEQLAHYSGRKKHFEECQTDGETECPNCTHRWIPGFDKIQYDNDCASILVLDKQIAETDLMIQEETRTLEANREYIALYSQFRQIVHQHRYLEPLWHNLQENNLVLIRPQTIPTVMVVYRNELEILRGIREAELDIVKNNENISLIQEGESVSVQQLQVDQNRLQQEMDVATDRINAARDVLERANRYKAVYRTATALKTEIENKSTLYFQTSMEQLKSLKNEAIAAEIRELQSRTTSISNMLNDAALQKGIVDDLKNRIDELEASEVALKILTKELSPTDGLIAEGLLGFIRHFVRDMNSLIAKIWSYGFRILDCGFEDGESAELNYLFPVFVEGADEPSPDVKRSSSGQREIADLAFRIVSMKNLGFENYPLFLDEFGASFDEVHRINASRVVNTIMEQRTFSQLFMISHYESSYGSLVNAEICVLNGSNIVVPKNYNQHVRMK